MRAQKLKHLFIHCSATPEGRNVKASQIFDYHTKPKPYGRGWSRPGYRLVIELDGKLVPLVENVNDNAWVEAHEITNGAKGYNRNSHHICYVGGTDRNGMPKDTRTEAQRTALYEVVKWYIDRFPNIKVMGHNEVAAKACPSFDVQEWLVDVRLKQF